MPLEPIPPDPEPRPDELEPFWIGECAQFPEDIRPRLARLCWIVERQRVDPNLFLVGFAPEGYEAYRQTPTWAEIRRRVLTRAGDICECYNNRATQVHHRDYRPRVMAGEDLGALVAVCKGCHDKIEVARKGCSWHAGGRRHPPDKASQVRQGLLT